MTFAAAAAAAAPSRPRRAAAAAAAALLISACCVALSVRAPAGWLQLHVLTGSEKHTVQKLSVEQDLETWKNELGVLAARQAPIAELRKTLGNDDSAGISLSSQTKTDQNTCLNKVLKKTPASACIPLPSVLVFESDCATPPTKNRSSQQGRRGWPRRTSATGGLLASTLRTSGCGCPQHCTVF